MVVHSTSSPEERPSLFDQISSRRLQEEVRRYQPEQVVERIFSYLKKDRERLVLAKREALFGQTRRTLEEIGREYGVTRERVRQIEKTARGRLRKPEVAEHLEETRSLVLSALRSRGGLLHEERLLEHLGAGEDQSRRQAIRFLLGLLDDIEYLDTDHLGPAWKETHHPSDLIHEAVRELRALLEREGRPVPVDAITSRFKETPLHRRHRDRLTEELVEQLLHAAKEIIVTPEREVGLRTWREVNPRSIRDKVYLILRSVGKPMHFTSIADSLMQSRWQKRPVTRQAVHNELIRDPRFVLVGRGIYGLAEWGHKPGTVSDVIERILREEGRPLHKDEIVRRVLRERQVKEATIVLNLQEKGQFVRVKKATYALAPEAGTPSA